MTRFKPMPILTDKDIRRIWSKVARSGTEGECWLWQGELDGRYGKISFRRDGRKLEYKAHRLIYFLHFGIDPLELDVCHSCDNPPCCNPGHLFKGTRSENLQDMMAKGRRQYVGLKGEEASRVKLTEAEVRAIRESFAQGVTTQRELAATYGVARSLVSRIILGTIWPTVTEGVAVKPARMGRKVRLTRLAQRMKEKYGLELRRGFNYGFEVVRSDGNGSIQFISLADIERTYFEGVTGGDGQR
jgi:hypothetical protein